MALTKIYTAYRFELSEEQSRWISAVDHSEIAAVLAEWAVVEVIEDTYIGLTIEAESDTPETRLN
ncbi:MAG: hypothetical protein WC284_18655, partial [Candidimonas sp.]